MLAMHYECAHGWPEALTRNPTVEDSLAYVIEYEAVGANNVRNAWFRRMVRSSLVKYIPNLDDSNKINTCKWKKVGL